MNKAKRCVKPIQRNEDISDRFDLLKEYTQMNQSGIIAQLSEEYGLCKTYIYYIVRNKQPKRYYIKKRNRL